MTLEEETSLEMSRNSVCRFNQFGFCKFRNSCFRKHINSNCENDRCLKSDCELRHPKMCRYYSEYSYCKFGEYCKFKHQEIIETKENEIKNKDMEIRNNEALELENRELKETIEELKLEVETLRNDKAVEFILFEDFKECMKLKYLYDSDDEESEYESNDEKRERSRELFRKRKQEERNMKNKCEKCDFMGKPSAGLITHVRKKH